MLSEISCWPLTPLTFEIFKELLVWNSTSECPDIWRDSLRWSALNPLSEIRIQISVKYNRYKCDVFVLCMHCSHCIMTFIRKVQQDYTNCVHWSILSGVRRAIGWISTTLNSFAYFMFSLCYFITMYQECKSHFSETISII